jgi:hypothetical protein
MPKNRRIGATLLAAAKASSLFYKDIELFAQGREFAAAKTSSA